MDSEEQGQEIQPREVVFRLIWCASGASVALGLALWITGADTSPLLLASLGGSTIFLFGLTGTAAAQPRALFGGHLGSALLGVLCYQFFGDALWVWVLSVVAAFIFMLTTRTVHPPAGANPLIMVHGHAGFQALWQSVGLGILILALVAFLWTRLAPGVTAYPSSWTEKSPRSIL